jgi:hypothetical protein
MVVRKVIKFTDFARDLSIGSIRQKEQLMTTVEGCRELAEKAFVSKDLDLCLSYLDQGLLVEPCNTRLIKDRVKVYFLKKMYDDVLEELKYLLECNPDDEMKHDAETAKSLIEIIINNKKLLKSFPIYQ